ncbi:NADH-quinone oxidoreductase subunit L [Acetivibrio straminisolvens]|jgi:ech hydrogenase subunit A|uniref:Energy-conserving hydrogenase n=1 Tax=Acetivibrio straminisolvens JCM 21531 TaxID=1294263 RepID=W4V4T3_9FIRM|nr:proton-conducting transporter membrane subunit [Acetivibrio straminisolvens]GAE88415.1 energy-conserving hydrogenase [Acetivibrio straminisolvens JCM 21531]
MNAISILVLFPVLASAAVLSVRKDAVRNIIVRICAIVTGILTLFVVCRYFKDGISLSFANKNIIDTVIASVEVLIAAYIIFIGIKNKKYIVSVFASVQTALVLWFEFTHKHGIYIHSDIVFDRLSAVMVLIVGGIGSLILIYTVGYMKWYHIHHEEYKERKSFFFSVIFLFLFAMFGLILSNNLIWMYFCWELTSICSYLLIGYTKTTQAVNNSFRALAINLGGGLAFAAAMVYIGTNFKTLELSELTAMRPELAVLIPVFLLCIAALTKSAQMPFSSWLLGAMVAPTPSSALLHSATMVKAGVYFLIRLAPLLAGTSIGKVITLLGAVTFLISSIIAISKSDAKKILAYSTISNLGLIVTCSGIGSQESLWAAILLLIFHSISKSLLFLTCGSVEHQIGSRNVEDMDILLKVSRRLSGYMIVGIAGMFLAPFGMLISKWVAMKAFIDSKNILTVIILGYGSATTLFYWTKWMGKLVSNANRKDHVKHTFHIDEEIPIFIHAVLVVLSCFTFPLISRFVLVPYLSGLFGPTVSMPIGTSDVNIMLIMLSMLLILPISFIPIYKNDRRRIVPVYMAGENTGDNESFYGALHAKRKVKLHNWYMEDFFGVKKLAFWSNVLCSVIILAGVLVLIGGITK